MKLSAREMGLGFATLAVLIVAGTWMWAEPRFKELEEVRRQKQNYKQIIDRATRLLSREDVWKERLVKLRRRLPSFREDERVTAKIMQDLEGKARESKLSLLKASPQNERKVGDLYELSINYRWQGELAALLRFLYALQSKSINMDLNKLSAAPMEARGGNTQLRGNFTVDVAYTRSAAGDMSSSGVETDDEKVNSDPPNGSELTRKEAE